MMCYVLTIILRSPALTLAAPPEVKLPHNLSISSCVSPSLDQTTQYNELAFIEETCHCTASSS